MPNKVIAGVIGQADVWTEPLSWIRAQNMLCQTDAEGNEGSGFAFANSQLGVPWLLVRGISDSVWYPNAYDGVISSDHAAKVVRAIVVAPHGACTETLTGARLRALTREYTYAAGRIGGG